MLVNFFVKGQFDKNWQFCQKFPKFWKSVGSKVPKTSYSAPKNVLLKISSTCKLAGLLLALRALLEILQKSYECSNKQANWQTIKTARWMFGQTKNKLTEKQPDTNRVIYEWSNKKTNKLTDKQPDKCSNKKINWQTNRQTEGVLNFNIDYQSKVNLNLNVVNLGIFQNFDFEFL